MQWGTRRAQLSMGSSMIWIRRLTCMVMLIQIGSTNENKNTLGFFFNLRSNMAYWFGKMQSCMVPSTTEEKYVATCSAICEVVCFFWKIQFDLIDMTCIFLWCREEKWISSMWSRSRSIERRSDEFHNNWWDKLSKHKILVKLVCFSDVTSPVGFPWM